MTTVDKRGLTGRRAVLATLATLAVCCALGASPLTAPAAVAEPADAVPGSVALASRADAARSTGSSAPGPLGAFMPVAEPERVPERYLPDPPADPWYADPPAIDPTVPAGTILDSRPAALMPLKLAGVASAWQVLVRSADTYGTPQAVVATILFPTARWTGPGTRPLVASDYPIDSLGLECSPSYALQHDFSLPGLAPSLDQRFLDAGMAVVVPDHEGPKGAYAAGRQAAHAVLDSIRGARAFVPPGEKTPPLAGSRIAQVGFSGGAIAAGWAAQVQPEYAPELGDAFVGTSLGGVPADFGVLMTSMNGYLGSAGLFRAAVLGVAREYPKLYTLLNPAGDVFAYTSRNACADELTAQGLFPLAIDDLTIDRDALADPDVREVLAENTLGPNPAHPREIPGHAIQIWQGDESQPLVPGSVGGINDYWVPTWAAKRLRDEWCAAGVSTEYTPVAGEHIMSGTTGIEPAFRWIDARLRGEPTPPIDVACR